MTQQEQHIAQLLDRYLEAETTLEQEQELARYFATATELPREWEPYREMFAWFDAGMPQPEPARQPKRRAAWLAPLRWAAAAAVVALVATAALHFAPGGNAPAPGMATPAPSQPLVAQAAEADAEAAPAHEAPDAAQPAAKRVTIQQLKAAMAHPHPATQLAAEGGAEGKHGKQQARTARNSRTDAVDAQLELMIANDMADAQELHELQRRDALEWAIYQMQAAKHPVSIEVVEDW